MPSLGYSSVLYFTNWLVLLDVIMTVPHATMPSLVYSSVLYIMNWLVLLDVIVTVPHALNTLQ
jgi:hypothetical protein